MSAPGQGVERRQGQREPSEAGDGKPEYNHRYPALRSKSFGASAQRDVKRCAHGFCRIARRFFNYRYVNSKASGTAGSADSPRNPPL